MNRQSEINLCLSLLRVIRCVRQCYVIVYKERDRINFTLSIVANYCLLAINLSTRCWLAIGLTKSTCMTIAYSRLNKSNNY